MRCDESRSRRGEGPAKNSLAGDADDLGHGLDVDVEMGLGAAEAAARLARHGPNEVQLQRDAPLWRSVLDQLRETMILVLLAARCRSSPPVTSPIPS